MKEDLVKQCKPLVTSSHWPSFEILLNDIINAEISALVGATDLGNIREIQGRIKAYRSILHIPQRLERL